MPRYLLDTNIVSELARRTPDPGVLRFMDEASDICVSVVVFHELAYGLAAAKPETVKALTLFVARLRAKLGPDALPVDLAVAEAAGRLRGLARGQGRVLHQGDALIAATTLLSGCVLATRNEKDFEGLGVPLVNPFSR